MRDNCQSQNRVPMDSRKTLRFKKKFGCQGPPKMDGCPFGEHVAPAILTPKCLGMDATAMGTAKYGYKCVLCI